MATELAPIDITHLPDLTVLAEEVRRTGKSRRVQRGQEDLARLVPIAPPSRRRGRRTSAADPLWASIGTVQSNGPTDVSENVDRYLADAYANPHQ